jgi:hypothetical protein
LIFFRNATCKLPHGGNTSDDSDAEMDDVQEDEWVAEAEAEELYY